MIYVCQFNVSTTDNPVTRAEGSLFSVIGVLVSQSPAYYASPPAIISRAGVFSRQDSAINPSRKFLLTAAVSPTDGERKYPRLLPRTNNRFATLPSYSGVDDCAAAIQASLRLHRRDGGGKETALFPCYAIRRSSSRLSTH